MPVLAPVTSTHCSLSAVAVCGAAKPRSRTAAIAADSRNRCMAVSLFLSGRQRRYHGSRGADGRLAARRGSLLDEGPMGEELHPADVLLGGPAAFESETLPVRHEEHRPQCFDGLRSRPAPGQRAVGV